MDIEKIFRCPVNTKVMAFFHENPSSIDTPRGVASWINEDRKAVKKAMDELAKARILRPHRTLFTTGYSYTQDRTMIAEVEKYLRRFRRQSK
jgi:hypothetical protein